MAQTLPARMAHITVCLAMRWLGAVMRGSHWDPERPPRRAGAAPPRESPWGAPGSADADGASLSVPFQLSGLFQLDDSYETCSAKSVLEAGERIQGGKDGGDEKDT